MQYVNYTFSINENGLKLTDQEDKIDIRRTPFHVGDILILTLDSANQMFFRKSTQTLNMMLPPRNDNQLDLFDEDHNYDVRQRNR